MHQTGTALCSWVRAIKLALEAGGCDSKALFTEAGLDAQMLDDANARYALRDTNALWSLAVRATGDACFGFRVAHHVTHTTFHALGYAVIASASLKEAFERVTRFGRIASDAAELELRKIGNEYHFAIKPTLSRPTLANEAIDAFVSLYVRMCRSRLGRDYSPLQIDFHRPQPLAEDLIRFKRLLRAPLAFDMPETRLIFDQASFEQPLPGANAELARHNDLIALQYLARFDREHIRTSVEAVLITRLTQGEPSQDEVAHALSMSARTLQRKLAGEHLTYTALLDETRCSLALSYLRDSKRCVSEVTYLLGFSDVSSFTRAFRRWTGHPPSAWRQLETSSAPLIASAAHHNSQHILAEFRH